MSKRVYINALAHYHPKGVLDNDTFAKRLNTTNAWIETNVGIKTRRFLNDYSGSLPVFELCKRAVSRLKAHTKLHDVDLIISSSTLDDIHFPGPGNMISEWLKIHAPSFHLKNACTSVVFAIDVASALVKCGRYHKILIVSGEPFTTQVDYGDRASSIFFGDAGAALIVSDKKGIFEIVGSELGGKGARIVASDSVTETSHLPLDYFVGGNLPVGFPTVNRRKKDLQRKFRQDGKRVYKFVLSTIPRALHTFLKHHKQSIQDVNYVIFHQANLKLMQDICTRVGIAEEKHLYNVDRYGNTSSAGWVSVLSEHNHAKRFKRSDLVSVSVFGAGMSWGNLLLRHT